MTTYRKKLIEVALPLQAISEEAASEKSVPRRGHPQTIHLWWARRPLAAARAVLFAQLVDDPSAWPNLFPTEEQQNEERRRLFGLLTTLASWNSSNDRTTVEAARREIAVSHARSAGSGKARALLDSPSPTTVDDYLATELPPVHDPFSGGGTIPLEAQRLGLRVVASDLNPVALLVTKALTEVPWVFAERPPVNTSAKEPVLFASEGVRGLAEDLAVYSRWVGEAAEKLIGHLYPRVDLPADQGGGKAQVLAWVWARTVESPNPAFAGCRVPLVSSFWLSTKGATKTWIEPIVEKRRYRFEVRTGSPSNASAIGAGTKTGRATFRCLFSGAVISGEYIDSEASAGRLGVVLMALVAAGPRARIYLSPTSSQESVALEASCSALDESKVPREPARGTFAGNAQGRIYGFRTFADYFSIRQLTALTTFQSLIAEARSRAVEDAKMAGLANDGVPLRDGGRGAFAYAEAISVYLTLGLGRLVDYNSTMCTWNVVGGSVRSTFARQAIAMTWDFYETNPVADTTGSWSSCISWVIDVLRAMRFPGVAHVTQADAASADPVPEASIICTDPPYYDNIAYADLSDFFYVWMRPILRDVYPSLFSTVVVPKDDELVAAPHRFLGDKRKARFFFEQRIAKAFERIGRCQHSAAPIAIFYAFKQSEDDVESDQTSSTGWETMLEGLLGADLAVDGTWPLRTERAARIIGLGANALASSVVLVCRKRTLDAPTTTRGEFRRLLRKELPDSLRKLQQGNIAPVDVAQASIGPGMAIFSRHKQVLEADSSPMTVRSALQLINEVLDEYLSSGEGDFDADTRFAIIWYEQFGWEAGPFGDAETLAKARNVSVNGVVEAGICKSAANKVRILKRPEMRPLDYDPAKDERPTIWEFTQHMIRYLEEDGETAAASLLRKLGSAADATRELAYRLYNTCERKRWAEDARSFNGLILAWPELEKLAAKLGSEPLEPLTTTNGKPLKKQAAKKRSKRQQSLFKGDDE